MKLREHPLKVDIKRQISVTDDLHESTATKRPACRKKLPIIRSAWQVIILAKFRAISA
jgi:hypothetical protein